MYRVLVLGSEEAVGHSIVFPLTAYGHEVFVESPSVARVTDKYHAVLPQALIIDGGEGITPLLSYIRAVNRFLPIVVLYDVLPSAVKNTIDDYTIFFMKKPCNVVDIHRLLHNTIRTSQQLVEHEYLTAALNLWKKPLLVASSNTFSIMYSNPAANSLFDCMDESAVIGKSLLDFYDTTKEVFTEWVATLRDKGSGSTLYQLKTCVGELRTLFVDAYVCNGFLILHMMNYSLIEHKLRTLEETALQLAGDIHEQGCSTG